MRVRKLDENGDYTFGLGQSNFWINQPEGVAQEVLTRLRLGQGEWFADLTEGTAWTTGVLGVRTQNTRDAVVRERVLDTDGVSEILSYFAARNPNTREWTAAIVFDTIYGPVALGVDRLAGGLPEGAFPPGTAPERTSLLGIVGTGGTVVTATPADLRVGPRSDIADFRIVSIDAGTR